MKGAYVLWPLFIVGSAVICYLLFRRLAPDDPAERRRYVIRYVIIGLLFVVFSFVIECIGVNAGFWHNKTSVFEFGLFKVSIEEIPIEFFAGILWLMLYNTFETWEHKAIFFVTSVGTVSYVIACMVYFGFLIHAKGYNIAWTFPYWAVNLGFLVLCDFVLSRRYPVAVSRE
jgi:hypothetical protein